MTVSFCYCYFYDTTRCNCTNIFCVWLFWTARQLAMYSLYFSEVFTVIICDKNLHVSWILLQPITAARPTVVMVKIFIYLLIYFYLLFVLFKTHCCARRVRGSFVRGPLWECPFFADLVLLLRHPLYCSCL